MDGKEIDFSPAVRARSRLERYVEAARLPLERAVFDLMAQVAAAVDEQVGGRYRVRLTAGLYAVRTNQRPFGTVPQPRRVRVEAGVDRRVNFAIDTGIR